MSDDILDILNDDALQDDGDFSWEEGTIDLDGEDDPFALDTIEPAEMTEAEAREITTAIQTAATATYILLSQAHEGKAYKAMGYDTWADYVKHEFDLSASRSYQLLDLSKAVKMLEEAAPEGTEVKLTEAQVRSLKKELPQITEEVKEATSGKDPDQASEIIGEIIEDRREQQRADEKETQKREQELADAQQDGYQKGLESAADAFLDDNGYEQNGAPKQNLDGEDYPDGERSTGEDTMRSSLSPEDSMNLYNFLNMLTGVESLPAPERILSIIPEDRYDELHQKVEHAVTWIQQLKAEWDDYFDES